MILGGLFKTIGTLGGKWLDGKKEISAAKTKLAVAQLSARTDLAKDALQMELTSLQQTGALDQLTVRQQAKSLFDEAFAILILTPAGLSVYGACAGAPPEMWGMLIIQTLHYLPNWYVGAIALLFVNYFGFRSLLRFAIKTWSDRATGFIFNNKKENKNEVETKQTDKN